MVGTSPYLALQKDVTNAYTRPTATQAVEMLLKNPNSTDTMQRVTRLSTA